MDDTVKDPHSPAWPSLRSAKACRDLLCSVLGITPPPGPDNFTAFCPFHESEGSRSKSLSVWLRDGVWFWKCHSGDCGHGTVVEAIMRRDGVSSRKAISSLVGGRARGERSEPRFRRVDVRESSTPEPRAARLDVALMVMRENPPTEKELAIRGISEEVARRFGLAYVREVAFGDRRKKAKALELRDAWLMPVGSPEGRALAIRIHREYPLGAPKCGWLPVGRPGRHGFATLFPHPSSFDHDGLGFSPGSWPDRWSERFDGIRDELHGFYDGALDEFQVDEMADAKVRGEKRLSEPVRPEDWLLLCPGELKAMACLSAGMLATSVTCGESGELTGAMRQALSGRRIAVLFDDDDAGHRFREQCVRGLRHACPSLKTITLGRGPNGKLDANDVARDGGPSVLRARVEALLGAAEELATRPIDMEAFREELGDRINRAAHGVPGTVHVIRAVVGAGKSRQSCSAINASMERFVIFVPSHSLGREYEANIPCAVRMISPEQATKEGLLSCPSLSRIAFIRGRGLPYGRMICARCGHKGGCPVYGQRQRARDARVLILQYQHLRLLDGAAKELVQDRVRVIDEQCLGQALRWRVEIEEEQFWSFDLMLKAFAADPKGRDWTGQATEMRCLLGRLLAMTPGDRLSPAETVGMDDGFLDAWRSWLGELSGWNLMPALVDAIRRGRWVRCSEGADGHRRWWLVRELLPDSSKPLLILDATAEPEVYKTVLAGRDVSIWPDGMPPRPRSEVIQFVDGRYPMMSLWDKRSGTPKKGFGAICAHLRKVVEATGIAWTDVGVVTLKRLLPAAKTEFPELPEDQLLNYGRLRGLNALRDCRIVACIGVQDVSDLDVAALAVTLGGIDMEPAELLREGGRKPGHRRVDAIGGDSYEVVTSAFADERLNAARRLIVTSEVVQAIGRARPYEERDWEQVVLLYTSEPLPMPVTRAMPRAAYLEELGAGRREDIGSRIEHAMRTLRDQGAFGYAELARSMSIGEDTLKRNVVYRDSIEHAARRLGLAFRRSGGGNPGRFAKEEETGLAAG